MRIPLAALATTAAVVLLSAGCTGSDSEPSAAEATASTSATAAPSDGASGAPSPDAGEDPVTVEPGTPEVAAGEGCAQVRAGIDAFNLGDYDETVDRFEAAVPLVEADADGSPASNQLVEAVRWYAELPADDYLDASRTSDDFALYKAITLGQCIDALLQDPGVAT